MKALLCTPQPQISSVPYVFWDPEKPAEQPGCFSVEQCRALIKTFHSDLLPKMPGILMDGPNPNYRSVTKAEVPFAESYAWVYEKILQAVYQTNQHWWRFDITGIEQNFEILRYTKNKDFYDKHIDWHGELQYPRKLSVVIQLSDPYRYQGGDTFLYTSREPAVLCKHQGSINVFPSFYLHEATPVKKGVRYALVGWITGPQWK